MPQIVWLGVFLLALAPLLAHPLGIGQDYPNHLARVYVQGAWDATPALQANYRIASRLIPDMALDLLAQPLIPYVTPYRLGQLFWCVACAMLLGGVGMIQRRLYGRLTWAALAAPLFLYNHNVYWGFANFVFSCGVALTVFAWWIGRPRRETALRIAAFTLIALALFFLHLLGFFLFALLTAAHELQQAFESRERSFRERFGRAALRGVSFLPALGLFGYHWITDSGIGSSKTRYGELTEKFHAWLSPTLIAGDKISMLFGFLVIFLMYRAYKSGWLRLHPSLRWSATALGAIYVLAPIELLGVWGVDFRFPFVLALLLIAGSEWRVPATRRAPALALLAGMIGFQLLLAERAFAKNERLQERVREAVAGLPEGAAFVTVADYDDPTRWFSTKSAASLAVIDAHAYDPLLFTGASRVQPAERRSSLNTPLGNPLSYEELLEGRERQPAKPRHPHDREHPYHFGWPQTVDYVVVFAGDPPETLTRLPELALESRGRGVSLYRVVGAVRR